MLAPVIVALIIAAVIGLFVWMYRSSRADRAQANAALQTMAADLGATFDEATRSVTGHLSGRAVTVTEDVQRDREGDYNRFARITVALRGATTLQVLRRSGALASIPGDLPTGDATFDRWLVVGTNDAAKVRQALAPDLLRHFVEWERSGWLWEVRVAEGHLRYAGGEGFMRPDQVEKTMAVLRAMVHLAERLE